MKRIGSPMLALALLAGDPEMVREECERTSPRVEELMAQPESGEVAFWLLDLAGLERLRGSAEAIAENLARRLEARGVRVRLGLGSDRQTTILAAAFGSAPTIVVPSGAERAARAPIALAKLADWPALPLVLAHGHSATALSLAAAPELAAVFANLERWGVRTLGELAALPAAGVRERLGELGARLQALAQARDRTGLLTPQVPGDEQPEIAVQFHPPVESAVPLRASLNAELARLGLDCERRDRVVEEAALRLRLAPRRGDAGWHALPPVRFPLPTREARAIAAQLELALAAAPPPAAVSGYELACRLGRPRRWQPRLFGEAAPHAEKLPKMLARLTELLSEEAVIGSPRLLDSHRPDAFALEPFSLSAVAEGPCANAGAHHWDRGDRAGTEASGGSLQMPRTERAYPAGPALRESRDAATPGSPRARSPWGGSNGSVPSGGGPAACRPAGGPPFHSLQEGPCANTGAHHWDRAGTEASCRPAGGPPFHSLQEGPCANTRAPILAVRRLRPPLPLARPAGVARQGLTAARLFAAGRLLGVVARAAGPWRNCGDWWWQMEYLPSRAGNPRETSGCAAWDEEEWDVELQSGELWRLRRERRHDAWYLDAIYD